MRHYYRSLRFVEKSNLELVKFSFTLIVLQLGLCWMFAMVVVYGQDANAGYEQNSLEPVLGGNFPEHNKLKKYYYS